MDELGHVIGSKLHQTIQRLDPSFDFRSLGFSTFTKYLEASPEVKAQRPAGAGDVVVELADGATPAPAATRVATAMPAPAATRVASATPAAAEPMDPNDWQQKVDSAWSNRVSRSGRPIPGPNAASDAARFLGVAKLSASPYKTLQGLLDASELLRSRWQRDGNSVLRR